MTGYIVSTIAQGHKGPRDLAVDEMHVYFTSYTDGTIVRVPKSGGDANVLATGQVNPWRIALDARFVYWVGESEDGSLMRVSKSGGAAVALGRDRLPSSVKVHGEAVYWATNTGRILRTSLRGEFPTRVLTAVSVQPWRIAVDGDFVYWTNANGAIMRVSVAGGDAEVLATGQGDPRAMVMDNANVYWTTRSGAVRGIAKTGGSVMTLASGRGSARGLGIDDAWVYWTVPTDGLVLRAHKRNGEVVELARAVKYPINVVSDGRAAYFTCYTAGTVCRVELD